MFIDIHAHAFRIRSVGAPCFCTTEQLLRAFDRLKIDMGVVLPVVNPECYAPQAVDDILEMAANHPDRIIPYCNVDPRLASNIDTGRLDLILQRFKDAGCKGIGEVMPNMEILDPKVQNLFYCAEKVGLPLVYDGAVQVGMGFGLYDEPGLPQLEYSLLSYPDLMLFGHGPAFWSEIAKLDTVGSRGCPYNRFKGQRVLLPSGPIEEEGTVPKLLRRYPNLMGDLSDCTAYNALTRDEKFGPRFLSEFEDRLFYGTDIMFEAMEVPLGDTLISWREQGKISETTFRKIAYGNAEKLFSLK